MTTRQRWPRSWRSKEDGLTYIHPFNDLRVATGQGTIAYEIFQRPALMWTSSWCPSAAAAWPAGVSTLAKLLNPNVKVIGVEPTGAACMKASLEAGHVVTLPTVDTIADGVAVKTPGDQVFPYIQENVDDIITIEDNELVDAFLDMIETHKMIVENAGLLTVAALYHLDCKRPERGAHPHWRQHGRHHHVLPRPARPHQPRPCLYLLRPAPRPTRRAAPGGQHRGQGAGATSSSWSTTSLSISTASTASSCG